MQGLPLEVKIAKTKLRIREWYDHWNGDVYVSFSGGKDSTVLLDLVRQEHPDVEAVFVDTGLEYPEIRKFVETKENVKWLKPKMRFDEVIKKYGYPVISKDVALRIYYAKRGSPWAIYALQGLEKDGTQVENAFKKRYIKYAYLLDAPFDISEKCCGIIKENPMKEYGKQSCKKPFTGIMAEESQRRQQSYLNNGCNAFESKSPISNPLGFWTERDILEYLYTYKIPYASIYGDIVLEGEKYKTTGADRTGCMFCMFGCHLDKGINKFQKMKETHLKMYDYCIKSVEDGGLGCGKVLDYIGVKY